MTIRAYYHLKGDGAFSGGRLVESLLSGRELLRSGNLGLGLGGGDLALGILRGVLLIGLSLHNGGVVGVQTNLDRRVLQRIALLREDICGGLDRSEDGLHLIGVDDTGKVGIGHGRAGKVEPVLELGTLIVCAKDGVKLLESTLCPDDKSSQVSTGRKVQQ